MHRPEYLDEVIELHKYIRSNLSCDYSDPENGHPKVVKYSDICGPFCDANVVIEYFAVRHNKGIQFKFFRKL